MYSQNEEEKYILEAAGWKPDIFLDIGAYDGKTFSNTLALVEQHWSGVLVEPGVFAFKKLLELHGENKRLSLVQALVGLQRDLVRFWNSEDALSTTESKNHDRWSSEAKFFPSCYVPQITIEDLVNTFPYLRHASMVNIDTEGTSSMLFMNFPFELLKPKVFCVELDGRDDEVYQIAIREGYQMKYQSSENMVFSL